MCERPRVMRALALSSWLLVLGIGGCSDSPENCGTPLTESAVAITVGSTTNTITGRAVAQPDASCNDNTSLPSVRALRLRDATGQLDICIPRPDALGGTTPISVQVTLVGGRTCIGNASAMAHGNGVCDDGTNPAGFELVIGEAMGTGTCMGSGDPSSPFSFTISGSLAIE